MILKILSEIALSQPNGSVFDEIISQDFVENVYLKNVRNYARILRENLNSTLPTIVNYPEEIQNLLRNETERTVQN